MKNTDSGKHTHRSPISMDNPELKKDYDWWDDICKAHGAENHWPKNKTKKEKQKSDEAKVSKKEKSDEAKVSKKKKSA